MTHCSGGKTQVAIILRRVKAGIAGPRNFGNPLAFAANLKVLVLLNGALS